MAGLANCATRSLVRTRALPITLKNRTRRLIARACARMGTPETTAKQGSIKYVRTRVITENRSRRLIARACAMMAGLANRATRRSLALKLARIALLQTRAAQIYGVPMESVNRNRSLVRTRVMPITRKNRTRRLIARACARMAGQETAATKKRLSQTATKRERERF